MISENEKICLENASLKIENGIRNLIYGEIGCLNREKFQYCYNIMIDNLIESKYKKGK